MLKRSITAVCLVAFLVLICFFTNDLIFDITMAVFSLISVYEMIRCIGLHKNAWILITSCFLGAIMPVIPYFTNENTIYIELSCCVMYMLIVFAIAVFSKGALDFPNASASFMSTFYISIAFSAIVLLREESSYLYLLVFICPWISDMFAYLVGRFFGRHKLIPEVSPNKTVEGSIGGVVSSAIIFVVYGFIIKTWFATSLNPSIYAMAISGAVISIISQVGDLIASMVKRQYGIKDYGRIFPGHGGVMDRFDSVLTAAPVLLLFLSYPLLKVC